MGGRFLFALSLVAALASVAEPIVQNGETVAFLGDSITYYGNSRPLGFVHLVTEGLTAVGVRVKTVPSGIGGHKSDDLLSRGKAVVTS